MFHRLSISNGNPSQRTLILISLRKEYGYGSIYQSKIEHCIILAMFSQYILFEIDRNCFYSSRETYLTRNNDWAIKTKRFSFPHRIKISPSICFISAFHVRIFFRHRRSRIFFPLPRKWYFSQGRNYSSVSELGESSFSLSPASVVCTVAQSNGLHISRTRSSV